MDAHHAPAAIRLRPDAFTLHAITRYGWTSISAGAAACGVSHSTLLRAIDGRTAPGETLVAALLRGTGRTFEDLFTVI